MRRNPEKEVTTTLTVQEWNDLLSALSYPELFGLSDDGKGLYDPDRIIRNRDKIYDIQDSLASQLRHVWGV